MNCPLYFLKRTFMKKEYFPLYDFTFRHPLKNDKNKKEIIHGKKVVKFIEFNVPLKITKLEIQDGLKKLYDVRLLKDLKLTKIRTLIQRGDRKLFSRNLYTRKNYKKVILTSHTHIKNNFNGYSK